MKPELIEFITSRTHLKADQVETETRLAEDLGLYGLDAISFFEEFFEKFEIENQDELDMDLHINGSVDFASRPLNWIKNRVIKERRKYLNPDVTIEHLDKVVQKGKWFNKV